MRSPLTCLNADVLQDLQISPNHAAPFVPCGKCGIDITDFEPIEIAAHARFHSLLASAPKSIPSQDKHFSHLWQFDRRSSTTAPMDWRQQS